MHIISYVHPVRTFLPCTGAGRHINNTLLGLAANDSIDLELLFSRQWLTSEKVLPANCPLNHLPFQTFSMPENRTERLWKLIGYPSMEHYISDYADWLYAPMETYIPVSKCPVAVTIHDIQAFELNLPWSSTWQHRWFRYKWGQWVRRSLTHCRIVFTVSEFSKQRMVELLGADPKKLVVVSNGIESAFFNIANTTSKHSNLTSPFPYVFMVNGLRQKKGGDYYLALAKVLQQRRSPIQIVIAGQIDLAYAKAAEAHPNITLLGVVPDDALPQLMRDSLCLLFLSLYEGFGIPPLEAMAAGVPAVVANRASLPEVVGDAGIVVEPENIEEVADILINLDSDAALRQRYVDLGQHHAAKFTWSTCVERLIEAFHQYA